MPTSSPTAPAAQRSLLVDGLKALASQLIVLHHLAFYGPMADFAAPLAPELFEWLAQDARMAVQIFLVIGGFMAIKALAPQHHLVTHQPLAALWQRAMRLALPYWFALALTLALTSVARLWMDHPSLSPVPTLSQLASNILMLQDVVDHDAISAGAWYVAIDLQLFALTLLLLWLVRAASQRYQLAAGVQAWAGVALILGLTLAGLFHFNLDEDWSDGALYFAGSYGLGAAAWWSSERSASRWWLTVLVGVGAAALWWHWRDRLLVALITAAVLGLCRRGQHEVGAVWSWLRSTAETSMRRVPESCAQRTHALGTTSYALFLVHFPICLVVNALFFAHLPRSSAWQLVGVLAAWGCSLWAARLFYAWVEAPAQMLTRARRTSDGASRLS